MHYNYVYAKERLCYVECINMITVLLLYYSITPLSVSLIALCCHRQQQQPIICNANNPPL